MSRWIKSHWLSVGVCASTVLPLLVALLMNLRWWTFSVPIADDLGIIELYTLRAARAEQLVGPYSRFGFHHPGPLLFYLLAPLYAISGRAAGALCISAIAINLTSVCVLLSAVWARRRSEVAIAVAIVALVLVGHLGAYRAYSFWNGYIGVIPFFCALLAISLRPFHVGVAVGSVALLSLAAQSHWMWILPAAGVALGWAVLAAIRAPRPHQSRDQETRPRSVLGVALSALSVAAVLWAPVAVEAVLRSGGNPLTAVDAVAKALVASGEASGGSSIIQGLGDCLLWAGGHVGASSLPAGSSSLRVWLSVFVAVVFGAAVAIARRRTSSVSAVLVAASTAGALLWSWVAAGQPYEYLRLPLEVSGAALLAIAAMSLIECCPLGIRWARGVALVLVAALSITVSLQFARYLSVREYLATGWGPVAYHWKARSFADDLRRVASGKTIPVTILEHDAWPIAAAAAVMIEKQGGSPWVQHDWEWMFGRARAFPLAESAVEISRQPTAESTPPGWSTALAEWCEPTPGSSTPSAYWFDGFYSTEQDPLYGSVRWSKGESSVAMFCENENSGSAVRLTVRPYSPDGEPVHVDVRRDGAMVASVDLAPGWGQILLPLNKAHPGGPTVYEFRYDRVRRPCEVTVSDDCRYLAVLFAGPYSADTVRTGS